MLGGKVVVPVAFACEECLVKLVLTTLAWTEDSTSGDREVLAKSNGRNDHISRHYIQVYLGQ